MTLPKILPFQGIIYNKKEISDLSQVVTPPYDVIDPNLQEELYQRNPHNFVRVDLAKSPGDERYEEASKTFMQWLGEGVLEQDLKPAFYFHHQTFTLPNGQTITRKGFFGVRRVEDFSEGGVKPHEKTLEGPKADRLKLTRSVRANLSPVFSLYGDPEKKIDQLVGAVKEGETIFDFKTQDGQRHQIWRVDDENLCKSVSEVLQNEPVFIADGHHRYETAINYRNECRQLNPPSDGLEAFNYLLMYFSNMNDDGLIILPIHRALHSLPNFKVEELASKLEKYFKITLLESNEQKDLLASLEGAGGSNHAFVLISHASDQAYLVTLDRNEWKQSSWAKSLPEPLIDLDVTVLHRLILEEVLGISQEAQVQQSNIIYWKDTTKAINETKNGKCDVTFLMNPTRIQDMEKVARAGEKMPQKSTFFYPKILSGLVVNPLDSILTLP